MNTDPKHCIQYVPQHRPLPPVPPSLGPRCPHRRCCSGWSSWRWSANHLPYSFYTEVATVFIKRAVVGTASMDAPDIRPIFYSVSGRPHAGYPAKYSEPPYFFFLQNTNDNNDASVKKFFPSKNISQSKKKSGKNLKIAGYLVSGHIRYPVSSFLISTRYLISVAEPVHF